jgi:hypothetical protein
MASLPQPGTDFGFDLMVELLRTGMALTDALGTLLEDIPEDAFPGEDPTEVLIEMLVGTCRPAIEAAGESTCMSAQALIAAIGERFIEDLRAAAARSRYGETA